MYCSWYRFWLVSQTIMPTCKELKVRWLTSTQKKHMLMGIWKVTLLRTSLHETACPHKSCEAEDHAAILLQIGRCRLEQRTITSLPEKSPDEDDYEIWYRFGGSRVFNRIHLAAGVWLWQMSVQTITKSDRLWKHETLIFEPELRLWEWAAPLKSSLY